MWCGEWEWKRERDSKFKKWREEMDEERERGMVKGCIGKWNGGEGVEGKSIDGFGYGI